MLRCCFVSAGVLLALVVTDAPGQTTKSQPNALVTGLRFAHWFGNAEALTPSKDRELKAKLIGGLRGKTPELGFDSVERFFSKDDFLKLAGGKKKITLEEMERMLIEKNPRSRESLLPKIRQHADLLTTQFDMIDEPHRDAADQLAGWIAKNYRSGKPLAVTVICTGNSRRSMLGSTMGNIAASYYGLPDVRFYSGGTAPSAFNPRTVATLKEIGVEIEPTGKEAPRGGSGEENPMYRVRWGKDLEAIEFSKLYSHPDNPQKGFAAILVCSEADTACPAVSGASVRIATPYMDPKVYDGAPFESAKYAERRDDIGRFMLNALLQARRRANIEENPK